MTSTWRRRSWPTSSYKQDRFRPDRDIILALTADEEIGDRDALGIRWLINNHRNLIDAEFALNEGGNVDLMGGAPIRNSIQTSEKFVQTYQLEVTNRGGHSSAPRADNAIYQLAAALNAPRRVPFSGQPQPDHKGLFRACGGA
jgi:acetylornithine deacetylase/succinyl-diaminopimelate desuccinylase-like protein